MGTLRSIPSRVMKPTQRPSGEKNGERPVSVPGIGVAAYSPRRLRWSWELGGVPSLNTMLEPSGAMAARKPSELPAALRTIMPPSTVHRRTTCWSVSAFARGRSQPHAATAASAAKRAVVPMAARRDAPGGGPHHRRANRASACRGEGRVLKGLPECGGALEAIGGELLDRPGHGGGDVRRHGLAELRDGLGLLRHDLHDDLLGTGRPCAAGCR